MPLHIAWDNDAKTIIRCEGEGQWTWDEYHAALDQMIAMMKSVDHRVNLIMSGRPGSSTPPGSPQPHYERAAKLFPPNLGANIVVTHSSLGRMMVSLWSKMPGNKLAGMVKLVGSMEEAYALIAREQAKDKVSG